MIAAQNEGSASSLDHGPHPSTVSFDTRRARVVESPAMHRTPEICIELEIGNAPVVPHRAENGLEMSLHAGMCTIQSVPAAFFLDRAPPAEGHSVRTQRFAVRIYYEPVRMLLKQVRPFLGDKRSNPNRGLEPTFAYLPQHAPH